MPIKIFNKKIKYPAFLRMIYFKYFTKFQRKTVHLRGRLSESEEFFFNSEKGKNLLNIKQFRKEVENDKTDNKEIFLEIGFGNGHHLLELSKENKDVKIYGVELYKAGVVKILEKIREDNLSNLKILNLDAREVLESLKQEEISEVYILFPDPWPKKSQQKNRLLNMDFIKTCLAKTKVGGKIIIATDWADYAEVIENNISEIPFQSFKASGEEENFNLKYKMILNSTFARRAKKEGRKTVVFEIYKK